MTFAFPIRVGEWYKGQDDSIGVMFVGRCTHVDKFSRPILWLKGYYYLAQAGNLVMADRPFSVGVKINVSPLAPRERQELALRRFSPEDIDMRRKYRTIDDDGREIDPL